MVKLWSNPRVKTVQTLISLSLSSSPFRAVALSVAVSESQSRARARACRPLRGRPPQRTIRSLLGWGAWHTRITSYCTGVCETRISSTRALAARSGSRNCFAPPDLVLGKLIFPRVFFSGGWFLHRRRYSYPYPCQNEILQTSVVPACSTDSLNKSRWAWAWAYMSQLRVDHLFGETIIFIQL